MSKDQFKKMLDRLFEATPQAPKGEFDKILSRHREHKKKNVYSFSFWSCLSTPYANAALALVLIISIVSFAPRVTTNKTYDKSVSITNVEKLLNQIEQMKNGTVKTD